MNQRLAERRDRRRAMKTWRRNQIEQSAITRSTLPPGVNAMRLTANSVRSAKAQVKRLYPEGGFITGYAFETLMDAVQDEDRIIYTAAVFPQGKKLPGGRTVYSSRWQFLRSRFGLSGNFPPGTDTTQYFSKPDYFIYRPRELGDDQ